jgi:hypothetical protein
MAACGLALLVAATDLCWRTAGSIEQLPTQASVPLAKPAALDPAKEAIRRRVDGPAIGLMIAGGISILPEVLGLLIVPIAILVPATDRAQPGSIEPVPTENAPTRAASPAGIVPTIMFQDAAGQALLAGQLPLLLGQYDVPQAEQRWAYFMPFWAGVLLLFYLLNLGISITMIVAGWRMRKLKSHGLAMVASSLALLPCTFGWIVALPMGIWSLTVLLQPEVREAFES